MRGKFFYFLFFFCNIPLHLAVVNPPYGQLQVQGIYITNSSGIPIQLQGMSLFMSQIEGKYWNQDVLVSLQNQWNSNVVRAAMAVNYNGYVDQPEYNYELVKAVIEGAINIGMYVIVDWHLVSNLSYTAEAITFFSNISKTYGSYPHIIYEIWNEPNVTWDVIVNHANQVIPAIRANDPNNIIIVGTPKGSSGPWFPPSQRLNYTNVVYTLHIYEDVFGGIYQEPTRALATTAMSNGIPIIVTEYGTGSVWPNETLEFDETALWYEYFDQYFISHTNWCMSEVNGTMSAIKAGSTNWDTPAAQIGAVVADSAHFTEDGIFVNQRHQNLGLCPTYWAYYAPTQQCYNVTSYVTYQGAISTCASNGGHVASVHSNAQNAFLMSLTNSSSTFKVIPHSQYWLGLSIDKTASPWNVTWADASSNDYGNWVVPTLGIANGNCSGACATIMYSAFAQNPGLWNVVDQNSGYFPAICQKPARDLTSPSAPHVVYSNQYWIGQTIDKANSWNSTWQDGTATNYGNWNNPSQGPNNGNCTNQVCAIIMYSATSTSARPGTWDAVAQNSGYYPAICQTNAI